MGPAVGGTKGGGGRDIWTGEEKMGVGNRTIETVPQSWNGLDSRRKTKSVLVFRLPFTL